MSSPDTRLPGEERKSGSKVLVFDSYPIIREGLAQLIRGDEDLQLCGSVETAVAAQEAIDQLQPHILTLDLAISRPDGLEFLKTVRAAHPRLFILVISAVPEEQFAYRAFRAGAQGFILKSQPCSCFLHAVYAILEGGLWFSPKVTARIVRKHPGEPDPAKPCPLSDRELQVYRLIGSGLRTAEIAENLGVSVKTVETYRERLKCKLNVGDGAELNQRAQAWLSDGCVYCTLAGGGGKAGSENAGFCAPG